MKVLIPEAWHPDALDQPVAGRHPQHPPQQRRGRWLSLFLGLLPLVMGTGGALLVSFNRHL